MAPRRARKGGRRAAGGRASTCISRGAWRSARTATSSATSARGHRPRGLRRRGPRASSSARAPVFEGRRVGSVFFGGGTPSLWEPRELGRVLSGVRRAGRRRGRKRRARGHGRVQPDLARRGPRARAPRRGREPAVHRRPVAPGRAPALPRSTSRRARRLGAVRGAIALRNAARLGGPHLRLPGAVACRGPGRGAASSPISESRTSPATS